MRWHWNVLVSVLITAAVLNVYYTLTFGAKENETEGQVSVIVLKLPRSGSSWFTELLNNDPKTFVSKEIVQSADAGKYSATRKAKHLSKALQVPTGKVAWSSWFLPSGRIFDDYWLHRSRKFATSQTLMGFTANPEHLQGVSWDQVVGDISNVKLVVYARSNVVKTAISANRGQKLKQICGLANMKEGRDDCVLPRNDTLVLRDLMDASIYWQGRYDAFYNYIRNDDTLSQLPTIQVYYEDLLSDGPETMQKLMDFLEHPRHPAAAVGAEAGATSTTEVRPATASPHTSTVSYSGWIKRSPDDLSKLYTNFDDVVQQLQPHSECAQLRKQLQDHSYTVFRREVLDTEDPLALPNLMACRDKLFPRVQQV